MNKFFLIYGGIVSFILYQMLNGRISTDIFPFLYIGTAVALFVAGIKSNKKDKIDYSLIIMGLIFALPLIICAPLFLFLGVLMLFAPPENDSYNRKENKNIVSQKNDNLTESIKSVFKVKRTIETYMRNQDIKSQALLLANYKCEVNNNHITFTAESTSKNYMEVHHIIPLKYQSYFNDSIDIIENVIVLCPNCHKALHYGTYEVKKDLLKLIIEKRHIELDLNILMKFYT